MPATVKQHQDTEGRVPQVVDDLLDAELRTAGPPNAVYWVAVLLGGFILNMLLLVIVASS